MPGRMYCYVNDGAKLCVGAHAVGSTRVNAIAPVRIGQVQKPCREMSRHYTRLCVCIQDTNTG